MGEMSLETEGWTHSCAELRIGKRLVGRLDLIGVMAMAEENQEQ